MPLQISSMADFCSMPSIFEYRECSPHKISNYFIDFIDDMEALIEECNKHKITWEGKFKDTISFDRFLYFLKKHFRLDKCKSYQDSIKKSLDKMFLGKTATVDIGYSCRIEAALSSLYRYDITPYYVYVNNDLPYWRAMRNGFECNTLFDYSPDVSCVLRELLISELSPTCKKLVLCEGRLEPVFAEDSTTYYQKYIISIMQRECMHFINDIKNIFKSDLCRLIYNKRDVSLLHEYLLFEPSDGDYQVFKPFVFEDEFNTGETYRVISHWSQHKPKVKDDAANYESLTKKIKKGSRVIVYGTGVYGKTIIEHLLDASCCDIVGVCCNGDDYVKIENGQLLSMNELYMLGDDFYDYVLLATDQGRLAKIKSDLILHGIAAAKIIF